ncbi:MAG: hypothetical protein WEA34_00700 [Gemmatimonadota bacterium]
MRRHFLAIAVILTVPTGCDNVAWGGIEVSVEAPETANEGTPGSAEAAPAEAVAPPEPLGPLMLAGTRVGSALTLTPVGLLGTSGLEPLPTEPERREEALEVLGVDSEWVLFAGGVRVGTATVSATRESSQECSLGIVLDAVPRLVPAAINADRLLALPATLAGEWAFGDYAPVAHSYDQRVASLDIGRAALPRVGAPWPANGMLPVRRDIRAFRPGGDATPSFAASFVVGDTLDTSGPSPTSYSLFLMADQGPQGFRETYLTYRTAEEGKAAPRFFGHLDWDEDGSDEVLLEVFGEGRRGYVALERGADGLWTRSFGSACPHTAGATER